ncbi:MAG: hypothetical protein JXB32_11205 [Deltaproteobacteria bacterium]|nr:hypothetical protein [Deltaproteobacteria bacterium]
MRVRRSLAWTATALLAGTASCDGCDGADGDLDVRNDVPSLRFCGDGACVVTEGENTRTCPADCGPPRGGGAEVRFFADFAPKAAEYGRPLRFTYVVWNQGSDTARNVVLPVPLVQDASTAIYGDREHCGAPGPRYDCMVDVSYVPDSMHINRVYHPNRARNSYAFVETTPLTDALDDDEAWFDADRNLLFLALPELRPRDDDSEDAGVLWSFELLADETVSGTPCEELPLVQNWNWILADNSPEYTNDIIGHIVCESPHLRATVEPDRAGAAPGDPIVWSVTLAQDFIALPPGREDQRFTLLRPRLYLDYPEAALVVESLDLPEEAVDLVGFDDEPSAGGVVYWARTDDAGEAQLAPGDSETLHVTTRVRDGVPAGTELHVSARVTSQRTREYQHEDDEATVVVGGAVAAACGDGFCTAPGETAASCAVDCPGCAPADAVTGFADPPCCEGLVRVRAAHPYGWAYDQCYDWEGGGVPWVQGYCTACGDGTCTGRENACNCPDDCGPHCGNWRCETGEDRTTCPADC